MARYYSAVNICILPLIADHPSYGEVFRALRQCQEGMETLERNNKVLAETRAQELCLYFDPNINNNVAAEPQSDRYNGFCGAIHATKTVITLLHAILLSGLIYFIPETSYFSQGAYEEHEVFEKDFVSSTVALHRSVSKVISGCRAGILAHELQSLVLDVREYRMTIQVMRQVKATEMQRCVRVLKGWAQKIIDELDDLVDEIVDARKMIRTCVFKCS